MVRKKRRALLKDAPVTAAAATSSGDSSSASAPNSSSAQPARVALERVLSRPPVDAELPFALGTADAAGAPPLQSLGEWLAHLSGAASLFEQLRVLQLFRSKLAKAEAVPAAFAAAAWCLLFRVYVAPPADALRKNVFLVLDTLARSTAADQEGGVLQQAAADELRRFLDRLCVEHAAPVTPEQSVHALDLLLLVAEFPFIARVLVSDGADADAPQDVYLLRFVQFCANQLAFLAEPIVDYSISSAAAHSVTSSTTNSSSSTTTRTTSTASTNVVLLASERCGHALKNGILLCTMKDFLYARLHRIEARHGAAGLDRATRDFLRILGHCVLILQTSVAHKDLLTQAGLAYCLVLRLLLQAPAAAQAAQVTRLLLQAMYPEQALASSAALASPLLRIHVDSDMASFGDFSRLAVYRGMLSGLSDDELVMPFAAVASDPRSVLEVVFTSVQAYCQEEALATRLYAFQVLETILRRAVAISQRQRKQQEAAATAAPISPQTLVALTAQILLNWEHPSKRVNQFMAQMFVHVVGYFALSADFAHWKRDTVCRLVEHPPHSRAKYGALSILLAEYDTRELLREYPSLLEAVLLAVGHTDVSAAAAGLFAQILDELHAQSGASKKSKKGERGHDAAMHEWRLLWVDNVVSVLVSKHAHMRAQVAMYVIPLLVKKDPACVPLLVEKLRAAAADADTCLWAIIEIFKFARKRLAPETLLGLSTAEIAEGLSHAKAATRSAAFDAICASLKSTTMPSAQELKLVQTYLALHGKEISTTSRLNVMIGLKNVFVRVKANLHASAKAAAAAGANAPAEVQRRQREDMELAQAFKGWVELFVVTSIYSGAIPQRQILGLNVLQLYAQVFGFSDEREEVRAASLLLTPHMVTMLLNMLASAWDVIRSLAYSILDLYPDELPGFASAKELELLLKWSMALCVSARQRESDAGGLFMRLLFKKSAAIAQYGITFQSPSEASAPSAVAHQSAAIQSPQAAFVLKLADVILTRLSDATSGDKARRGELPLVHGLLLSLRYIVEIVDFEALSQSVEAASEWRVAIESVFQCVRKAMRYSLFVVGEATAGVGDEELSEAFSSAVVVGEVNSLPKTDAIPLRVDCRGHLILEDGEVGDDENDTEQRAVVGSWLAARECGSILEVLMRRVPAPRSDSTQPALFTTEMATQGGEILLHSLFELKHKGAVATAYQAFEGVCRSFLANGERNAVIGGLPRVWADRLLERLERSEQHFILRRSSGFAFSFVAILRSEPRNAAAVILPKVMANLLRLASLDTDALAAAGSQQQQQHQLWRSRVHALNILKLICQDAILADDVSVYVAEMLELAVFGFDCSSWAVRNSSMMLFAATTQRALGDKRIADGASTLKVSSDDVFSRFQQLHSFIYRELVKCTAQPSATPPPGLYPILMFMSRLKPGDDDASDACAEQKALSDFAPLVRRCASQPTMAIRQMAAKVLATITRDEDAVGLLQELTAQLPNGVRSPSPSAASAAAAGTEQPRTTSNFVHGVLAQIQCLVAKFLDVTSAQESGTAGRRSQAALEIAQHLASELFVSKMWLWTSERLASGVLRAAFLDIVDAFVTFCYMTGAAAAATEAVEQILGAIQTQCAKDLQERCPRELQVASAAAAPPTAAPSAPGQYVADRALVSIFFRVWQLRKVQWRRQTGAAPPGAVLPLVERMLQSGVLEVRKKATKQLANAIRGDAHLTLSLSDKAYESLRAVLAEQLLVEPHPKVKARQLALLVHCQTAHDAALPSATRDAVQAALLADLAQSADAEVLAPALELLALTVRQDAFANADMCAQLKREIAARASELQPLALRQAAARALRHSGFLLLPPDAEWKAEVAVDSWLAALTLLQDDDVSTRALVRDAVRAALAATAPLSAQPSRSLSDTLVLPQAVAHVVERFVHTAYGVAAVSRAFLALVDAPSVLREYTSADGARGQDWGDLCDRIFEAESSNFFAEPDAAAQLFVYHLFASDAAGALQKRPRSNSSGLFGFGGGGAPSSSSPGSSIVASEALAELRRQVLERVEDALTQLSRDDAREQWIGGITYYSSVFAPLLSLLTAGVAVAVGLRKHLGGAAEKKMVAHIASLARVCAAERFEVLHPLLRTALELLSSAATPPTTSSELSDRTIASLLHLTPYWKALGDE